MAGLYDRFTNNNNLPIHYFIAQMQLYHGGKLTLAQVKNRCDNYLIAEGKPVLGTPAKTDIDNIITEHDSLNTAQKAIYMETLKGSSMSAENGDRTEVNWRADLNIT